MADNSNPRKNGSGYSDPTAYAAIKKITRDGRVKPRDREKDVADMMHVIKRIAEILGFEIEGHIVFIDKQTRKRYE
jgi:hypothetical protein